MAFQLQPTPDDLERKKPGDGTFNVFAEPLVDDRSKSTAAEAEAAGDELPRSYGSHVLTVMPRDPHSLFAYWDVDWQLVFQEAQPADRKVHLRVLNADGVEESSVEVEPMIGSCYVTVQEPDASYAAELGYFHPATVWKLVARSETVQTPPAGLAEAAPVDFATVPFHLSFQRMMDVLRVSKHESASLTEKLSELRERAAAGHRDGKITPDEQEIVRAIDHALATTPAPSAPARHIADASTEEHLERILGIRPDGGSSPTGGFGGSSRAW